MTIPGNAQNNESLKERFVSLHGFFAFEYPQNWKQEGDEAGHYIFYNDAGGAGVLRVMIMENEFSGDGADKRMLEEVYNQNKHFNPSLYAAGKNRFVHFVKEHDVSGVPYTVYYWATAYLDKVLLFTYTLQTAMKEMPVPQGEKQEIEALIASLEFLHNNAHHG